MLLSHAEPSAPFAGVGVVPGSGATPTPASPAPDTVPGSGAASGAEGAAEPSAPFAGVCVVWRSTRFRSYTDSCISGSCCMPVYLFGHLGSQSSVDFFSVGDPIWYFLLGGDPLGEGYLGVAPQ